MSDISIGDNVKIIHIGGIYNLYTKWVEDNAPEYLSDFAYDIFPNIHECNSFKVVVTGFHPNGHKVCLIQDKNSKVYLMRMDGIEKIPAIRLFSTVYVADTKYCYANFENWLKTNNPYMLKHWTAGELPEKNKEYLVCFLASKANFPPFDTENLFLISPLGSSPMVDDSVPVFVMDQQGLILKK